MSFRRSDVTQPTGSVQDEEATMKLFNGAEVPPFRGLDDFLLESARYERPPLNDLTRWNNRIIANLLYYQTNYFSMSLLMIALFSFAYGKDFVLGLFAICLVVAAIFFSLSPHPRIHELRKEHPLVTLGGIVASAYLFITFLPSVVVIVFSTLAPTFICLVHASCRLRNLKNKTTQFLERAGLRRTVMGQLIDVGGFKIKTT
ncbi:unnamed protein product, partial [Mesorhabditis spiculigera]